MILTPSTKKKLLEIMKNIIWYIPILKWVQMDCDNEGIPVLGESHFVGNFLTIQWMEWVQVIFVGKIWVKHGDF